MFTLLPGDSTDALVRAANSAFRLKCLQTGHGPLLPCDGHNGLPSSSLSSFHEAASVSQCTTRSQSLPAVVEQVWLAGEHLANNF